MKPSYFVSGTDTDVGKTLITAALLHALVQAGVSAVGMKPVAAGINHDGSNTDLTMLQAAGNVKCAQELRCQYLFAPFCAPHIAAKAAGVKIALPTIVAAWQELAGLAQAVVVEGVGGFRVPLTLPDAQAKGVDTADLAQTLGLPVILVVGMRLGCINHALLSAEAIAARGLKIAAWVANVIDPDMLYLEENIAALAASLGAPLLGRVPRLPEATAAAASACLDFSVLPDWPN